MGISALILYSPPYKARLGKYEKKSRFKEKYFTTSKDGKGMAI
jgi:hypothetical protein